MPLYNNVIRKINEADDPNDPNDEDKLGYGFWEGVENLPVIKQIGQFYELADKSRESLQITKEEAKSARKGESGRIVQALQYLNDTLGIINAPFEAVEGLIGHVYNTGVEALSDSTNVDRRTIDTTIGTMLTLSKVKGSKTTAFKRGANLKSNLKGLKRKVSNIGKPASQQVIDTNTIMNMHPTEYRRVLTIYRNHEGGISWKQAMERARLSQTSSPDSLTKATSGSFQPWQSQNVPFGQISPNITNEVYDVAKRTDAQGRLRKRKGESDVDFANRLFQDKFNKVNLTEDARLDVESMLDTKNVSQKERRNIKMGISNPNYSPKSYIETRQILVEEFLDGLEFLGLTDAQIEAHHIASLRQTASLFIGLPRSEFIYMLKLIYDNGIPTGNDPDNLMAIQKKAHVNKKDNPNVYAVHTYLNEQLGLYGEKLVGDFGINIKDLTVEQRLPFIKKFAAVVKGSVPIAEQAIRDVLDIDVQADSPEAAAIASLDIQEYEISKSQMKQIKAKVDDYIKSQLTEPNYQALIDSIMGEDSPAEAMRRLGIKPGQPVQGQLLNIKKPPRKTKKKNDSYPSGSGAYWDIESE